jgi:formamidopyrimidine-DNA glycosylase
VPELPEVETVRSGLAGIITGRTIVGARVLHPRPVRRHPAGPSDFESVLVGRTFAEPRRRGKFLWFPLDGGDAIVAHLGMSGQFRSDLPDAPLQPNTRVVWDLDDGRQLRFIDQRMFGGVWLSPGGADLPPEVAHIALDPFDPRFDPVAVARRIVRRHAGIKRLILDQTLVSGIGNIYADESLWRARLHYDTPSSEVTVRKVAGLLRHAHDVMADSLIQGGTSFDRLYVDVNGESGYHERSLDVYGREGLPCRRCGRLVVREAFANRSSYRCPSCQKPPARLARP